MMYTTVASVLVVFSATLGWSAVETSKTYTAFRSKQDTKRVCAVPFLAANVEVDVSLDGLVARYRCADEVTHRLVGRRFGVCKGNGWFPAPPTCEPEQDEGAVEYDDIENDVEDSAEDYDEYDDEDSAEEPIFYECWNT